MSKGATPLWRSRFIANLNQDRGPSQLALVDTLPRSAVGRI